MATSSIEWTKVTWNPITGCDPVSSGCKHCYAEVMSKRLQAKCNPNPDDPTIDKNYTLNAKGECQINGIAYRDIPESLTQIETIL